MREGTEATQEKEKEGDIEMAGNEEMDEPLSEEDMLHIAE